MPSSKSNKPSPLQLQLSSQLMQLREDERVLLRDLAKKDLWTFATEVLWPDVASTHYHEPLHRPICEWISRADKGCRNLLLIPRNHRKTMLGTVAHSVWRIVKDPNVRIILVSALDDTAQHFTQMIKRQFQYNEHFLSLFPEYRVQRDGQFGRTYDFTHPMRTNYNLIDPTFRSFYLGAPVAGRRCDILIADDPIEKRHVTTPEQADKSLKDFNDLLPIVDSTGQYDQMFVVGTRWSYNDIYGAMLGEERGDESDVKLATTSSAFSSIVRHCLETDGAADFDHGAPILPIVFTRESLLKKLEEYRMDTKRGEEDWWKQYMNICISPSGKKFEEAWFETDVSKLPGSIVFSCILCDSATKDEQILMRGDFTVAIVAHFDSWGHLYLTDAIRSSKMKGADLIRELLSMCQRCEEQHGITVTNFVKEKVGEDTFFGWVRSEFTRARRAITIFPLQLRGHGKKYVRIVEALQHPTMARQVHFVAGFPDAVRRALVDEAIHLGQWSHDDTIDCLSLAFHPDIRVKPQQGATEWKVPYNARVQQLSTGATTPAAITALREGTKPSPPLRWSVKGDPRQPDAPQAEDPYLRLRGTIRTIDDVLNLHEEG